MAFDSIKATALEIQQGIVSHNLVDLSVSHMVLLHAVDTWPRGRDRRDIGTKTASLARRALH
jgi:hypothetical protein